MKNKEIADIFDRIADMLDLKGDNLFRINSYRKAARVINDLTEDIEVLAKENKLKDIPGIGAGMSEKIEQYISEGKIDKYEEIKKEIPEGVMKMLQVPGVGPKTVSHLYKELKIKSIEELEQAIEEGRLKNLSGMGDKKEENILKGIKFLKESGKRMLLGIALPIADEIVNNFKKAGIKLISYAGSLRRMQETVGDIDILIGAKDGKDIIKKFVCQPNVKDILASGDTKGSVIVASGVQIDVRVVAPESFSSALQYFTGSKSHNVRLREIAKAKGFKLNEYGLFRGDKNIAGEDEQSVYKMLGLEWIPPVLREDRGEIDLALKGKLPKLVSEEDIKGDLHVHSEWSDGINKIEDIAKTAKEKGYSYIAITDHSQSLKIAGGLNPEDLEKQIDEIRKINKRNKDFKILCGAEVDIKNDGSMDFPDFLLSKLDIVLGAIHTGFKQDKKTLTKRIVTAMKNPNVDIIVHPSGRIIGVREPYDIDMEYILKTAFDTNTALEINCHYDRLDITDLYARKAKEMGVKISLGTDSHHIDQLWTMRLGVAVAGRGWLEKKDILNTMTYEGLIKYLTK